MDTKEQIKTGKAIRVGDEVSLKYRGSWLVFVWKAAKLVVCTDANGDVWAYSALPEVITDKSFDNGVSQEDVYATPVHYLYRSIADWKDSAVEFEIK